MPVKISKTKGGKFKVSTPKGVKSKGTTKKKALAQERLLNAIDNNPNFVPNKAKRNKKKLPSGFTRRTKGRLTSRVR